MKYVSRFVLKALSILTLVAQGFLTIASVAVIFATVAMFFVTGDAKNELDKYVLGPTGINKFTLFFGALIALVVLVSLIVTMSSLRKVINNISQQNYFVATNLTHIRMILISSSTFTVANIFSMLLFSNGEGRSVSSVFANTWSQILIYLVFIAIIYTIYLVFKYGVELQNDSNTVI